MVLLVVAQLFHAAALRFVNGLLHGARYLVGIHNDEAVHVAGGAASRLRERTMRSQETLFVGIEDGHE